MMTVNNADADADAAREALPGLAHASRTLPEPGDSYAVLGSLASALAALCQCLDQLADGTAAAPIWPPTMLATTGPVGKRRPRPPIISVTPAPCRSRPAAMLTKPGITTAASRGIPNAHGYTGSPSRHHLAPRRYRAETSTVSPADPCPPGQEAATQISAEHQPSGTGPQNLRTRRHAAGLCPGTGRRHDPRRRLT